MKPSVILAVVLLITQVLCDDLNPNENSNSTEETNKNKRGIYGYHGYGQGLHYNLPHFHSAAHHVTPYAARFPTFLKSFHYPNGYALSHGGATVTSHNVNYPRYAFHSAKPHFHVPVHSPLPRPLIPTPPVVLASKPIVPVPTFTAKPTFIPFGIPTFSNRVPIIVSKPIPAPFHPGLAGQFVPFTGVQSQFVPVPIQPTINSFPAVAATPTSIPLPGTTYVVNNGHTDPWHPILVNQQPTPTTIATTNHVHRPAVNLLPPYGQVDQGQGQSHQAQLELQQDNYDGGYPDEQYAGRVSQLYLSPNPNSEKNQPLLQQQQPQYTDQDISQIAFDQQTQGRGIQFNYDPPSNNGQYSGPSSYEVALGSYTRAF